jgi:hypothetical protein
MKCVLDMDRIGNNWNTNCSLLYVSVITNEVNKSGTQSESRLYSTRDKIMRRDYDCCRRE